MNDAIPSPPYEHWPITDRPRLQYPGGKRMALYVGVNIEHFHLGKPSTSRTAVTATLPVDALNYGWRDYGVRVGFWRMLEGLDQYEMPVSALINTEAAAKYPEIVAAGHERNWAFVAHGFTNSQFWAGFEVGAERDAVARLVADFSKTIGSSPRGWLGPGLTETADSPSIMAEHGFTYTLDWPADEQPFPIATQGGEPFISVPYSIEINDIPAYLDQSLTPVQFTQLIVDQFQQQYEDAAKRPGAVLGIAVHPFLAGHPFRYKRFREALREISNVDDVWYANTDEIAAWYLENQHEAALASIREYQRTWGSA